jgi:hypothetical protein
MGQRVAMTVVDTSNDLSGRTGNNGFALSGVGNGDHWNYYRTFADFNPGSTNGIPFCDVWTLEREPRDDLPGPRACSIPVECVDESVAGGQRTLLV